MKKIVPIIVFLLAFCFSSCGEFYYVQKEQDYEYRYEAAKSYFMEGKYAKAASLLTDLIAVMKGTTHGEESLYMLAQAEFSNRDYETAGSYFKKYYQSYPKGVYVQQSRYYSALAEYYQIPDVRLDQSNTWNAIKEFNSFIENYPYSKLKPRAQERIVEMQDKLVEKEYLSAKLYYDLGSYILNCAYGGNNYEACVITAQNALKDYPYASPKRQEELSILILRGKYQLAKGSVEQKRIDRYRDAIDEYYSFVNDYPESKYLSEAQKMLKHAQKVVKNKGVETEED